MASKYSFHSHLPEDTFRRLLHGFIVDLDASKIAQVLQINRNTVNRYFGLLRQRIAEETAREWGTAGRLHAEELRQIGGCFGVVVSRDQVRAMPVDCLGIPRSGVPQREDLDGWRRQGVVAVIDLQAKWSDIVDTEAAAGAQLLARDFCSFAEERLRRFRGLRASSFLLHMKECEWRFNHRGEDLYAYLHLRLSREPLNAQSGAQCVEEALTTKTA